MARRQRDDTDGEERQEMVQQAVQDKHTDRLRELRVRQGEFGADGRRIGHNNRCLLRDTELEGLAGTLSREERDNQSAYSHRRHHRQP